MSEKLYSKMIGCLYHSTLINHLVYGKEKVLFFPSAKGLQTLTNCCFSEGNDNVIKFNETKKCICDYNKSCTCLLPELYLGCKPLNQVDVYKHLGIMSVIIC